MMWENEISRDYILLQVSEGYPILQQHQGLHLLVIQTHTDVS